jgi:hypothetical protein
MRVTVISAVLTKVATKQDVRNFASGDEPVEDGDESIEGSDGYMVQ